MRIVNYNIMTREEKLATLIYDSVWTDENEKVFVEKVKSAVKQFLDEENEWHSVADGDLPPIGEEVIGYSKDWVDEDFNPRGTRACFLTDNGWISAMWWDYQDTYITISDIDIESNKSFFEHHIGKVNPTLWAHYPNLPKIEQ